MSENTNKKDNNNDDDDNDNVTHCNNSGRENVKRAMRLESSRLHNRFYRI